MGNHVHLLLNPLRDAQAIPLLMKTLSGQATRRHNRRHDRSGSLWEARYRCRLVDTTEYLLRCCCYIERNPVEAGLAGHPASYPWSSYRLRMGMGGEGCFTPDMVYLALGNTEAERRAVYRGWIQRA
ncbi:hypothetical protein AW878_09715 [Bordetella pseudohinzii]|uniref:Transposase and inactivated derivatives n=2 Tax=Bordetella pseudohinzii TaxID=1331258 RepID=A0A0M7DCE2_9BORD|nr:hypothetical protein BBN53_04405 [Bordetella pseudohinzii]KXA76375.1 hypothetical protein AW877_17050 [Bordetella pseudohinzii]KXA79474.1 hypothetical protein AW878_09715 [Bordetella pseudohinzii]CUI50552.1 Transposase and inactivated derivatives [Bordetella pseudohinzii]